MLQTSDLDKANRFYGELLGFSRLSLGNTNVSVFSVNERQQLIVSGGLPPDRDERLMTVGFTTTSLWDMRSFLKALGANPGVMTTDPIVRERVLDVIDPDGHHVRFVEWNGETPPPPPQDRRISRRILHAGLTIRDVASADRFYKDLLGFSEIWRGGRTPDVTSWINMRVPDATEYLEYMLVMGERVDRRQLGTLHHVALVVPDMQEALLTVRSRTASDDPNHRATPQIGRNNRWQLNLYDPDGTRIELMEPWTVR